MSFRLFGILIKIQASFLILAALFASWINDIPGALELTVWGGLAILIHELGHAWAFIHYGYTPRIELFALGGVTYGQPAVETEGDDLASPSEPTPPKPLTHGQHVIVALAGPGASILLGLVLFMLLMIFGQLPYLFLDPELAITYPLFFSFGWGILNLIPILPLDGGNILRHLLEFIPNVDAEKIAAIVALVLGGLIIAWTLSEGQIWNSMIIGLLLLSNVQRLRKKQAS